MRAAQPIVRLALWECIVRLALWECGRNHLVPVGEVVSAATSELADDEG
jgi:hypothetical protein